MMKIKTYCMDLLKVKQIRILSLALIAGLFFLPTNTYAQPKLLGIASGNGSIFAIDPATEEIEEWVSLGALQNPGGFRLDGSLTLAESELFGYTESGGQFGRGVLYSVNLDGTNFQVRAQFPSTISGDKSDLVYQDGKLWGITNPLNQGFLYYFDPLTDSIVITTNFVDSTGRDPISNLTVHDGKFWGIARFGGDFNKGTIFSVNTDGTNLQAVHHFSEVSASGMENITMAFYDGKLWGTNRFGGTNSRGYIFSFDVNNNEFQVEYTVLNTDEATYPDYGLVVYQDKLWGILGSGGDFNSGALYYIDPSIPDFSPTLTISFGAVAGSGLNDLPIVVEAPGVGEVLSGITENGGENGRGTIFFADPLENLFVYVSLDNEDLEDAAGGLTHANGKLYSMQTAGGATDRGGLLSFNQLSSEIETLYEAPIESPSGVFINSDLFATSNGFYIGECNAGGRDNNGTIFSIDREGENFTVLYDFPDDSVGVQPRRVIEKNGRIFGITGTGGNNDEGVIFTVDAAGQFGIVHHFEGDLNGRFPVEIVAFNGRIWGYTSSGGPNFEGVLFSFAEDGTDFQVENAFGGTNNDGARPQGDLTIVGENLMGTTRNGGNDDQGTLYMVNAQNTYQKVYDYIGELDLDERVKYTGDKAWGLTDIDATDGFEEEYVLYSIDLTTYEFTSEVNWQFPEVDGEDPDINPEPLFIYNETIWGVFLDDEILAHNFLWKYDPLTTTVDTIHVFDDELMGLQPHSELIEFQGKLWGLTEDGGLYGDGVIYRINEDGTDFKKVADFGPDLVGTNPEEIPLLLAKGIASLTAPTDSLTYGDDFPILTVTSDSEQEFVFSSSDESVAEIEGNSVMIKGVGSSILTTFHEESAYYFADSLAFTLNVAKAALTISVDSITRKYQEPNSVLAPVYEGFAYEEDENVLTAQAVITTDATQESDAGTYDISVSGATADNYEITHENGTLYILAADQEITFNSLAIKFIDSEDFSLDAIASSGLDVSYELSTDSVISLEGNMASIIGPGNVEITATQTGSNNYLAAEAVSQTLIVQGFTTSVEESLDLDAAIYPNPATGQFQLQTEFLYEQVRLYDLEGKMVKRFNKQDAYNVENLPAGTYLLEVRNTEEAKRGRLVIQ
ncbi:MAG: choice-of-anchor tandem repeat GloVer-containing protein [Bacteroidota bacterium]